MWQLVKTVLNYSLRAVRALLPFCIVVLVIFGALVAILFLALWRGIPGPTRDVRQYERIPRDWDDTDLVVHFPPEVPAHARNVKFSSNPGALQSDPWFQLRLELPPDEVLAIQEQARKISLYQFVGGSKYEHRNRDSQNAPTTNFHTGEEGVYEFPDDYTLYVLHAAGKLQNWAHGKSSGLAISQQRNEVIYWANTWY